ncbi:retinol dehydrogenase 13 isoform X3 [Drosophila albomicans]|uniref:Retinol dehydrogenase 13 isoform X3 n=1 Tax=Drosophila albomicans TaxID=7291 RepID=A0A9C6SVP8_DROAB|nr:retinol dehydrogenase 13 isoform X3 [Drosophila albomicans]
MERLLTIFENADPFSTWWPTIAAVAVGIVITVRTIMSGQRCPNDNQIKKQIVVVTGGNSGIGFEIAKALGGRGARIILACRNLTAGERAAAIIKRELGCHTPLATAADGGDNINPAERYFVEARHLDLSSFRSVHQFAARLMSEFEHIDVLVNNAGLVFGDTRVPTPDGFEQHSQVNYLAPFLLTQLLLPHLKRAEQGRIVFVSAHAHQAAKIDFDDPLNVGTYAMKFHARDAFAHSKLAVILATRWLAKVLKDTSVTVNCCTPGLVRGTRHLRNDHLPLDVALHEECRRGGTVRHSPGHGSPAEASDWRVLQRLRNCANFGGWPGQGIGQEIVHANYKNARARYQTYCRHGGVHHGRGGHSSGQWQLIYVGHAASLQNCNVYLHLV